MTTIEFGETSQVEPGDSGFHPVPALRSPQQEALAVALVGVVREWIARIDRPRIGY